MPSMYGIFTYIWLNFMVNVGKFTSPMDAMATAQGRISNQDDEHEFRRARFLRPKTEGIRRSIGPISGCVSRSLANGEHANNDGWKMYLSLQNMGSFWVSMLNVQGGIP